MYPKSNLYFLTLVMVLFLFSSCTKEVMLDSNHDSKLCLNCVLNPDSIISAHLSVSRNIETHFDFESIDNATILLFENDILLGELSAETKGNYSLNIKPISNNTYQIRVVHPDFPELSAFTKVPVPPNIIYTCEIIDSTHVYFPELGMDYYTYNKSHTIDIYDPKDFMNIYWLRSFDTNAPFIDNFNRSLDAETKYGYTYSYYMRISDVGYNGETLRLRPTSMRGLYGKIEHVWAADTHYDQYLKSTFKAQLNREDELPFHEPVQIYSNIENGYGIFGSCAITTIKQ